MFFMGGMTLGYLHPPVRTKRIDAEVVSLDDDRNGTKRLASAPAAGDGAIERTLLWARRILC